MKIDLEIVGLSCRRGGRTLFENLAATVAGGGALAVVGPNGAGKTSLLRQLAGFLPSAHGTIRFAVAGVAAAEPEERARFVGWLGVEDGLKSRMTVGGVLAFYAGLYAVARPAAAETLTVFGLSALTGLPVHLLSAGQKRRLALARLVLSRRPLWLLDEPFTKLDAAGRDLTRQAMRRHRDAGGIVVAATHEDLGLDCPLVSLGARP